jgi:hypothetical protein
MIRSVYAKLFNGQDSISPHHLPAAQSRNRAPAFTPVQVLRKLRSRWIPTEKLLYRWALLGVCCLALLGGCRSRAEEARTTIEFTRIPPAETARTDRLDVIQGRAVGARPGQQIVIYARSGAWWLQPLSKAPFTQIQSDASWINSTHLGSEYAALLVEPGYRPPQTLDALPNPGGEVVAVAAAPGATSGPTTAAPLLFSGYEWRVRYAPSNRGNRTNPYDPSNAWTDDQGALHLRITRQSGTCAEVALTRSLGYGTYTFVVRDTSQLEAAVVLDMFTWDYAGGDQNNREMNIEVSHWGDPASKNAQYVVQPFFVAANVARFDVPAGVLTHSFDWKPDKVSFKTTRGALTNNPSDVISERVFTSGVPSPGAESVRIALYIYGKSDNPIQKDAEVILEKFEYSP